MGGRPLSWARSSRSTMPDPVTAIRMVTSGLDPGAKKRGPTRCSALYGAKTPGNRPRMMNPTTITVEMATNHQSAPYQRRAPSGAHLSVPHSRIDQRVDNVDGQTDQRNEHREHGDHALDGGVVPGRD